MADHPALRYVESPCKDVDNVFESTSEIEYLPECRRLFPEFSVISPSIQDTAPAESVETRERLRVYARIKRVPRNSSEAAEESCVVVEGAGSLLLQVPSKNLSVKQGDRMEPTILRFTFTQVYGPEVSQKEVFDNTVKPLVQDFLQGNNCLVFTYGVTNSGKTYTVQGTVKDGGLLPRSLDVIFNSLQGCVCSSLEYKPYRSAEVLHLDERTIAEEQALQTTLLALAKKTDRSHLDVEKTNAKALTFTDGTFQETISSEGSSQSLSDLEYRKAISDRVSLGLSGKKCVYSVWVAFYEIYNELIYDLLDFTSATRLAQRHSLQMAEDQHRSPFIKGLKWVQVHDVIEVLTLLNAGRKNQSCASTKLNLNSSRSHSIFTVRLIRLEKGAQPEVTAINEFSICDLAGSERSSRTQSVAERLQEACSINTSLLTLGKCIAALRLNQQSNRPGTRVVPFRESKLTRLFQIYLLGKGKTCMMVNINPSSSWYTENLNVLRFSAIARQVLRHFPSCLDKKRTQADCSSMIVSANGSGNGAVPDKPIVCSRRMTATCAAVAKTAAGAAAGDPVPIAEKDGEGEGIDEDMDDNCSEDNSAVIEELELEVERLKEELRKEREDRKMDEWKIRKEINLQLEYMAKLDEKQRKDTERSREQMEEFSERRIKLLEDTWKSYHEREMRELQESCEKDKELVPMEKLMEKEALIESQEKRILELEVALVDLQQDLRTLHEVDKESFQQLKEFPKYKVKFNISIKDHLIKELHASLSNRDKELKDKIAELASLKTVEVQLRDELSRMKKRSYELLQDSASENSHMPASKRGPAFGKTQAQETPLNRQGDLSTNRTHFPKALLAIGPHVERLHGSQQRHGSTLNSQNMDLRSAREVPLPSIDKGDGALGSEPMGCDGSLLLKAREDVEWAHSELQEAPAEVSRLQAENLELLARCGQQEKNEQGLKNDLAQLRRMLEERGGDERLSDAEARTNPDGAWASKELHRTKCELLEVMRTLTSKNKELDIAHANLEEIGDLKEQNKQLAAESALQAATLCEQAQTLVALDRRLEGSCAELREKAVAVSIAESAVADLQARLAEARQEVGEERGRLEVASSAAKQEVLSARKELEELKTEHASILEQLREAKREVAEKVAEVEEARVRLAEFQQLKTQNEELFNKSVHQADTLKEVTEDCQQLRKELEQCLEELRDKRREGNEKMEESYSKEVQMKAVAELDETKSKLAQTRQELERATIKCKEAQKELADVRVRANGGSNCSGNFHRTMAALEQRCEQMADQAGKSESGAAKAEAAVPKQREVEQLRELLAEHEAASVEAKARESRLRREACMAQDAVKAANRLMAEWEAKVAASEVKLAALSRKNEADSRRALEQELAKKEELESSLRAKIAALQWAVAERDADASRWKSEVVEGRARAVLVAEDEAAAQEKNAGTDAENREALELTGASEAPPSADVQRLEANVAELVAERDKLAGELATLREANGVLCQELQVCEETMTVLESRLGSQKAAERLAEGARAEKAALEEQLASVRVKLHAAAEESDELREKLSDARRQMQHVEKEVEAARVERERAARLEQELERVRTQGAQCMAGRERQLQVLRKELQQEREKSPSPRATGAHVDDSEPVATPPVDGRRKEEQRELMAQLKDSEQRRNMEVKRWAAEREKLQKQILEVESKKEQELRAWREERDRLASDLASEFDSLRAALAERDAEIRRLNAAAAPHGHADGAAAAADAADGRAKATGGDRGKEKRSVVAPEGAPERMLKGAPHNVTKSLPQQMSIVRKRRSDEDDEDEENKSMETQRRRSGKQPRLALAASVCDGDAVVLDRSDVSVDGGGHVPRFPRCELAICLTPLKQHQLATLKASNVGRDNSYPMKLRSKAELKGGCEQDGSAAGKMAGARPGAEKHEDTGHTGPMQRIGDFLQSSPTRIKSCAKHIAKTFKSPEAVGSAKATAAPDKRKGKRKLLKLEISSPMDFSSHTFVDHAHRNVEKESHHSTIMRQLRRHK